MRGETALEVRRARVRAILPLLLRAYPGARCSLDFQSPLQLLVATILSAQCTDARVNLVTPMVFARYPSAAELAAADVTELESLIRSTGFYRNKARSIIGMGRALVERHGGEVPRDMGLLTELPGVGRKTANVVLGNAFGIDAGITVDTHVTRLSHRLGLTRHRTDAVRIERDLMPVVPREHWTMWSHLLIHHGRAVCRARSPDCGACLLLPHCPHGGRAVAPARERGSGKAGTRAAGRGQVAGREAEGEPAGEGKRDGRVKAGARGKVAGGEAGAAAGGGLPAGRRERKLRR